MQQRGPDDCECLNECRAALEQNLLRPVAEVFCGYGRVGAALPILRIRSWTTAQGGISTLGFESTIERLSICPEDERHFYCALNAPDRIFDVILDENRA